MKWMVICSMLFFSSISNWELGKNEKGIRVYTRSVEGSPIKEVKADLQLDGSLSSVVAFVKDIPNYPNWMYGCSEARILKMNGDTELYFYQRIKAPWPVSDRDLCAHYVIRMDTKTGELKLSSRAEPKLLPEVPGVIRVKNSHSNWTVKSLGNGKLSGEYHLVTDPAGLIPAWLINMFITDGPLSSLSKMKEGIKTEPYKSKKFSWIKE